MGEKITHLHCNNCSGQNKNKFVQWYFAWHVQVGLHTEITLNFKPPGHIKFATDRCLRLLKRCFHQPDMSCLQGLQEVVKESTAISKVNVPQLIGREDGTVEVPSPAYKPLLGIKPIEHYNSAVIIQAKSSTR